MSVLCVAYKVQMVQWLDGRYHMMYKATFIDTIHIY